MRPRNLNTKYFKSLPGVEKERFKIYTKFLCGDLVLEHLHPSTHTIFSSKNSQLAPILPENIAQRNILLLFIKPGSPVR
jgi:hypothetical protein